MYKKYESLKKYVDMIGNSKTEEEALEVVVKIALDAVNSQEVQDAITNYVNECFDYASIQDTSIHA